MIGADLVRAAAIGLLGILSIGGVLELWMIIGLIAFVGLGDAFFNPASTAIVPDLLPKERLPQANALQALLRPIAFRLVGPALGGFLVATVGPGSAFVIDGASFLVSAAAVAFITPHPMREAAGRGLRHTWLQMREGLAFVVANPWCWATLVAAMFSLLLFVGPMQVLLPFLVKNSLDLDADALGAIFAVGGVGSIAAAMAVGQRGLSRRPITVMYAAWTGAVAVLAGYGVMTALWQALLISFLSAAMFQIGSIIWITMLQQLVPRELLGRVSSLDWLVSAGLVPVSFALTGPAARAFGPGPAMIGAGLLGAFFMGALVFVPGVRRPEQEGLIHARPAPGAAAEAP